MSTKTYREFVAPYNSRILKAFGGGCVHYCGNATHHADTFLAMEGLKALNIYNLYNIRSVAELQKKLQDRIALFVCDFTPWTMERISMRCSPPSPIEALVVCSQYSPVVGLLKGGKYDAVQRDLHTGRRAVFEYLQNWFAQR